MAAVAILCTLAFSPWAGAGGAQVSGISFTPANSAAHATGNWAVGFKSSPIGALAGGAGFGYVVITFPDGFTFPGSVVSGTWGSGFSCQGAPALGEDVGDQSLEFDMPSGCTLAASKMGHVAVHGITNPAAGVYSGAGVATSSDFTPATGGDITITAGLASPTISTVASAGITIGGGTVRDTATLSGGSLPTGTITFRLYGPNDGSCSTPPAFTSIGGVVGGSGAFSAGFTPSLPGKYRWRASYSGDAGNNAVAGACNDANESVVVSKATPKLSTTASPGVTTGHTIKDTAALSKGFIPTGTLHFKLYGPDDGTCSGSPVFTSPPVTLSGNGGYQSAGFTPTAAGTYRWIASYAGDANNNAVTGHCNDATESVKVQEAVRAVSGLVKSASSSCVTSRKVTLFRETAGSSSYVKIGSDLSSSNGLYKVNTSPVKSARYYVTVAAKTVSSSKTCAAAQSSTIRYQGAQGAGSTPQPTTFDTTVTIKFTS